jgi:hypothetical protein
VAVGSATLLLFSSGARPLYARNVLEILANPAGHRQLLRYNERLLDEATKSAWGPGMSGTGVLMHYVLQHGDDYFEPAFFPVRAGTVAGAYREGSTFFVEVALGDDVSLVAPKTDPGGFASAVEAYRVATAELRRPKQIYATLEQTSLLPALHKGDAVSLFEVNAELLVRATPFELARFIRLLRVLREGDGSEIPLDRASGAYVLEPGWSCRFDFLALSASMWSELAAAWRA